MKPNSEHAPLPADAGEESIASLDKIRNSKGNLHTAEIRRRMQRTMQVGETLLQLHLGLLALLLCGRRSCWLMAAMGCVLLQPALPFKQELTATSLACPHSHTGNALDEVEKAV